MKINIQARGFELTDSLRDQAERRLRYARGWADDRVRSWSPGPAARWPSSWNGSAIIAMTHSPWPLRTKPVA